MGREITRDELIELSRLVRNDSYACRPRKEGDDVGSESRSLGKVGAEWVLGRALPPGDVSVCMYVRRMYVCVCM